MVDGDVDVDVVARLVGGGVVPEGVHLGGGHAELESLARHVKCLSLFELMLFLQYPLIKLFL